MRPTSSSERTSSSMSTSPSARRSAAAVTSCTGLAMRRATRRIAVPAATSTPSAINRNLVRRAFAPAMTSDFGAARTTAHFPVLMGAVNATTSSPPNGSFISRCVARPLRTALASFSSLGSPASVARFASVFLPISFPSGAATRMPVLDDSIA